MPAASYNRPLTLFVGLVLLVLATALTRTGLGYDHHKLKMFTVVMLYVLSVAYLYSALRQPLKPHE